jgi:hypothetical protein
VQLCVWSITSWTKRRSKTLPLVNSGETRVQAHADHSRILVTHESMLGVYDADMLELLLRVRPAIAYRGVENRCVLFHGCTEEKLVPGLWEFQKIQDKTATF